MGSSSIELVQAAQKGRIIPLIGSVSNDDGAPLHAITFPKLFRTGYRVDNVSLRIASIATEMSDGVGKSPGIMRLRDPGGDYHDVLQVKSVYKYGTSSWYVVFEPVSEGRFNPDDHWEYYNQEVDTAGSPTVDFLYTFHLTK